MSEYLKQRFKEHSVTPPLSAWDGIAVHLDQQHNTTIAEKVKMAEVDPPVDAWGHIFSVIAGNNNYPNRIVGLISRKTLGRAAAVAGILMIGSFLLITQRNARNVEKLKDVAVNKPVRELQPVEVATERKAGKAAISLLPKISSLYSALGVKKKIYAGAKRKLFKTSIKEKPVEPPVVSIPAKPIRDAEGEIIQYLNPVEALTQKYVNVTGPNGQQTKISAKFASFLLYLNDDDDTDQKEGVFTRSFLESLLWKSRFQNWRNIISQTAYVPSSTNFMDILEFRDLILQENETN